MGGTAGLRPQPLGDLERDADLEAVAGQREREEPLGALEAVEDRVAGALAGPLAASPASRRSQSCPEYEAGQVVDTGQLELPRGRVSETTFVHGGTMVAGAGAGLAKVAVTEVAGRSGVSRQSVHAWPGCLNGYSGRFGLAATWHSVRLFLTADRADEAGHLGSYLTRWPRRVPF